MPLRETARNVARRAVITVLGGYRGTWNFHARTKTAAYDAILTGVHDETTFDERGRAFAERLRPLLPPGALVLDIGCGMGRVEKWLAPICAEAHGIDVSNRMLRFARERCAGLSNVHFHLGTGRDLQGLADASFDLVFSVFVLQHMEREDVMRYLAEIRRVLRPGGRFYLQFPSILDPVNRQAFLAYALRETARGWGRMRYYTPTEVEALLAAAGLAVTRVEDEGENFYVLGGPAEGRAAP